MSVPTSMSEQASTPVKRMPILSSMRPEKKSMSRNTLMKLPLPEKKP